MRIRSPVAESESPPDLLLAAAASAVVMTMIVLACGGGDVLTGRPVSFSPDAVMHYALAKTVIDDGWTWHAPRLAAPFGCDLLAFGLDLPLESALLRLGALTTGDCIALLNRTWLVLGGIAAAGGYAAFRLLGFSGTVAFVCGCLSAATPHVYLRSVAHFNLHAAFLPVPVAAAVLVLADGLGSVGRRGWLGVRLACFVAGLGFVYYSFFLAVTFAHALAIAWLTGRRGSLRRGLTCLGLLLVGAALNVAPVAVDWAVRGKPAELAYRTPQDADIFSLRIRDLILPSEHTPIPGLKWLGRRVAEVPWPLPTESRFAKLGTLGALGFVVCLWVLAGVRPPGDPRHARVVRAAATLVLVLVMVGVMGGFGSIFNLFVTPTIRCYNRVMPLLAVLALVPCASILHVVSGRSGSRFAAAAVSAGVLLFGLVEQNTAAPIRTAAARLGAERADLERFVQAVERDAPAGAAVLMLPATAFPVDHGCGRMPAYDHARAYLFSRRLRWSWPVFGPRQRALLESLGPVAEAGFVGRVRAAGFAYAWLDRYGADAEAAETALEAGGCELVHADAGGRYRCYALPESGS